MKIVDKLADKFDQPTDLEAPTLISSHERKRIRIMSGLWTAVFGATAVYSTYRLGIDIIDIDKVMPANTESDEVVPNILVNQVNIGFATLSVGSKAVAAGVSILASASMQEVRKRYAETEVSIHEG